MPGEGQMGPSRRAKGAPTARKRSNLRAVAAGLLAPPLAAAAAAVAAGVGRVRLMAGEDERWVAPAAAVGTQGGRGSRLACMALHNTRLVQAGVPARVGGVR